MDSPFSTRRKITIALTVAVGVLLAIALIAFQGDDHCYIFWRPYWYYAVCLFGFFGLTMLNGFIEGEGADLSLSALKRTGKTCSIGVFAAYVLMGLFNLHWIIGGALAFVIGYYLAPRV